MIAELLIALGVTVATVNTNYVDCGGNVAGGCYNYVDRIITIPEDQTESDIFYHEVGHALLFSDPIALALTESKGFGYRTDWVWYIINGKDYKEEAMADLFRDYIRDRNKLSLARPCLVNYIDYKINKLLCK